MTTSRRTFVAGLAALGLLIAGGLVACNRQDNTSVRIGYLNITASLPLFIAQEKGYFAEEGVTVETIPMETSNQLVDGVIANNLDAFIESSAVPVLAANLQAPGKLKVFAASAITKDAPFDGLLVPAASGIKSLSDLGGKKVGVFPGTTASHLLKKYLADHGVSGSVTTVPLPPPSQLGALAAGSIDALHAYEPVMSIGATDSKFRVLYGSVYADMLDRNPQGVGVVSATFVKQHPEAARRAIRALERAMAFMKDNDAEARTIMQKKLSLPPAAAARTVFLYMTPHATIDQAVLQAYADMLTSLGELPAKTAVESLIYRD